MRTQALSSNLTTVPSFRWYCFFVLTTTACLMSPRLTLFPALTVTEEPSGPKFLCFCTTTTIRSPVRLVSPPPPSNFSSSTSGSESVAAVKVHLQIAMRGRRERVRTDFGWPLCPEHLDALDDCRARVVDAVNESLDRGSQSRPCGAPG